MVALPAGVVRFPSVDVRAPGDVASPVTLRALPRPVNLLTYRGDDFAFSLTVWEEDGTEADLSAATIRAQVRATPDAADPPLTDLVVDVTANVVELHLPAAESAKLPHSATWDCEMVRNAWTTTLAAGNVVTTADVTR